MQDSEDVFLAVAKNSEYYGKTIFLVFKKQTEEFTHSSFIIYADPLSEYGENHHDRYFFFDFELEENYEKI